MVINCESGYFIFYVLKLVPVPYFVMNIRGGDIMDVDLIFKLAALGILVSVLNLLLSKSGRDDYGLIVTLSGLLISLLVVIQKVNELFETIKTLFNF